MGADPYFYFVPYQKDIQAALQALRETEFKAGRYDPAMRMADPPSYTFQMRFPPDESWPTPGAQHASIEEALEASEESGTGSILDLSRVGSAPDFFTVCPLHEGLRIVRTGLTADDRVIVSGGQRVRPNLAVAPQDVPIQDPDAPAAPTGGG